VEALAETEFVHRGVALVREERERLRAVLTGLGFEVVPSDANFLLTFPPQGGPDGPELAALLRTRGIAARTFPHVPRLARSIRFTVGRREDNERLVAALQVLREEVGA
jgi:histidinol-phosphate aminotransferase